MGTLFAIDKGEPHFAIPTLIIAVLETLWFVVLGKYVGFSATNSVVEECRLKLWAEGREKSSYRAAGKALRKLGSRRTLAST